MRMNRHTVENADYGRARQLRKSASGIEQKLWFALREACGAKDFSYRRQHPIHPYIVDFVCLKAKLLIEIDGDSHDTRQGYDAARDAYLRQKGYSVMRIGNRDVAENLQGVIASIIAETEQKLSPRNAAVPPPLRGRLGGGALSNPEQVAEKGHSSPLALDTAPQGASVTPPHLTSPSRGEELGSGLLKGEAS